MPDEQPGEAKGALENFKRWFAPCLFREERFEKYGFNTAIISINI